MYFFCNYDNFLINIFNLIKFSFKSTFEQTFLSTLTNKIRTLDQISLSNLIFYINTWNLFLRYQKLAGDLLNERQYVTGQMVFEMKRLERCFLVVEGDRKIIQNSPRQFDEISRELQRLDVEFCRRKDEANRVGLSRRSILNNLFESAAELKSRLSDDYNQFAKVFKSSKKLPDIGTLERKIWNQCKFGHVYSIGESGETLEYKLGCPRCQLDSERNLIQINQVLKD